jgi:ABC-type nitrate/sulfonate/bicarbonate transport system permease component
MDQVFAGILVIMALALISYQLMRYARQRMYPWETEQ